MQPVNPIVAYAVRKVQRTVTGAAGIPPEDLEQEAALIMWQRWDHWRAHARNIEGYGRTDLANQLANRARAMLRTDGRYGSRPDNHWQRQTEVADPASIRSKVGTVAERMSLAVMRASGDAIAPHDTYTDVMARLAESSDPKAWKLADDAAQTVYGRSARWARTFAYRYPEAAEEFLTLADRMKPSTVSMPEFERRQDRARERLRERYAAEIASIDRAEGCAA
jgi:hypothetical protein